MHLIHKYGKWKYRNTVRLEHAIESTSTFLVKTCSVCNYEKYKETIFKEDIK